MMANLNSKKIIIALAIVEALVLVPTILYVIFYK
jgi:hypothetical protein